MMQKLKTFFRRLKSSSLRRMGLYADKARADSGRAKWLIVLDMLWCVARYGVGYLDYLTFGFVRQNAAARRTYMTMNDNLRLVKGLNVEAERDEFEDKTKFVARFGAFVRRDWIDLRAAGREGFAAFAAKHPVFFAKEPRNFGGYGVSRVRMVDEPDAGALFDRLLEGKQFLCEDAVVQHIEMNRLSQTSVNTIRVVTLAKNGQAHVMYALVRMGSGETHVDNISSGGMYAPAGEDGVIYAPAFCDKTGEYCDVHPKTGTKIVGFEIPMFGEAIEMVKRAAGVVPGVRYVGWDVAISRDGPLLIEGNTIPSYDMCQNYRHLREPKLGCRPRFVEVLGDEFEHPNAQN